MDEVFALYRFLRNPLQNIVAELPDITIYMVLLSEYVHSVNVSCILYGY